MTDLTALAGATIAFDLDGTLVDSAPDLIGTLNVILQQEGIASLPVEEARPFIGHGARRLIERGFAAQGHPAPAERMPELFERFIAHYNDHSADLTRPFPGTVAALQAMKDAGTTEFHDMTEEERAEWYEVLKPVHEKMADRIGPELIQQAYQAIGTN